MFFWNFIDYWNNQEFFQGCVYCLILNYHGSLLRCLKQLCYYIKFKSACQEVFILFKTFLNSCSLRATQISYHICFFLSTTFLKLFTRNGERGIWTLAPVARPTPLAGAPLRPLEYFSLIAFAMPTHYTRITLILSITFSKFFNTFLTNQKITYS